MWYILVQAVLFFIAITSALAAGWFKSQTAIMSQRPMEYSPDNLIILQWLVEAVENCPRPWFVKLFLQPLALFSPRARRISGTKAK